MPKFLVGLLMAMVGCGPDRRGGEMVDSASVPASACKVQDDGDALPACTDIAPPGSFTPAVKWTWTGATEPFSVVTPLVANLTNDNGDGAIDLCDTPDVLVVAHNMVNGRVAPGHIYLLDGKTGAEELMIPTTVDSTVTPAIGDIDHDGIADIVTVDPEGHLYAFDHTGKVLFGPTTAWPRFEFASIALADLDHDGHVEILAGNTVFDSRGNVRWTAPEPEALWSATTAADLDGDGNLEVVLGASAYHHDGTLYWQTGLWPGFPQIADFDGDARPEVVLANPYGLSQITHDGTVVYRNLRPTGVAASQTAWMRPATIHDFIGGGGRELAMSSADSYTVYRADGTIVWSAPVSDDTGVAAGTAFDFLGNGRAEAMYADEHKLYVFDDAGQALLSMPRTSITLTEYPVVADVDNDGAADIVVVSNQYPNETPSPTVQVIHDKEDRWIQARRIWNQHTYHVTNVREDGTIPEVEAPSWTKLNTFRTNAQISAAGVCQPVLL